MISEVALFTKANFNEKYQLMQISDSAMNIELITTAVDINQLRCVWCQKRSLPQVAFESQTLLKYSTTNSMVMLS